MRSCLVSGFCLLVLVISMANTAAAALIDDLIGAVELSPVGITLDTPYAATSINGVLHVAGSHNGQAARQLVDLTTGTVGQVELFDSFLSANGGGGNTSGLVAEVADTPSGPLYVGESAGRLSSEQPTYWFTPRAPQGGVGTTGAPTGGFYLDVSNDGVIVGSNGAALYATPGNLPQSLPGASPVAAVDISRDSNFIAGSLLWEKNVLGGYDVLDTSAFDFALSGGPPTWQAVAIDPAVGDAVFAGEYFSLGSFTNEVGFWRNNGEFLFSAGSDSRFADFQAYDGQLVAAVNGTDDARLFAITDGSSLSMESILGSKMLLADDGLFAGSVGFLLDGPGGAVVTTYATTAVPEPSSCLLLLLALLGMWLKRRAAPWPVKAESVRRCQL